MTDDERNAALAVLEEATGAGRLSLEELDRRTDVVLRTASRTELAAATADVRAAPSARPARRWLVPFGNRIVRGRFLLGERTWAFMVLSEIHLDLRGAVLQSPEPVITVRALVGNLRLLIPGGLRVVVDQRSLFGGRTLSAHGPVDAAARPQLTISMVDVLGTVKVTTDPQSWSPSLPNPQ